MKLKIKILITLLISLSKIYCQDTTSFYPLQVGNKWFYDHTVNYDDGSTSNSTRTVEIVSDLMINDRLYYVEETKYSYGDPDQRYLSYNPDDSTMYSDEYGMEVKIWYFGKNDSISKNFGVVNKYYANFYGKTREMIDVSSGDGLIIHNRTITFASGIGIIRDDVYGHSANFISSLRGCIINDIHYGNTTSVKTKFLNNYDLNISNYPNPFNNSTLIKYSIPKTSFVNISIFDLQGRKIKSILNKEIDIGKYEFIWNTNDMSSGIYLIKITTNENYKVRKCNLLKIEKV